MTLSERIRRLEELRKEGIDWSGIDEAMYGPLPERRKPAWLRRQTPKDLTGRVVS